MSLTLSRRATALAFCGLLAAATLAPVAAAERPAPAILADINAVSMPQIAPQDRSDREKVQAFIAARNKAMMRKSTLIGELYQAHPDSPELAELLPERWKALSSMPGAGVDTVKGEVADVLARSKEPKLVAEASFLKVVFAYQNGGKKPDPAAVMAAFEEFAKRSPKDERGAMVLAALAELAPDAEKKEALNRRIEKDYPDSPVVKAKAAARRQAEGVGKPFAIDFNDAIKGAQVSSASLKGKVVIVDFWATWCGPCVAEMPTMKKLYAEYKDKGVEFVGVSLDAPRDQGGYDALKGFVEKNEIQWPQYYEGKTPATEFASAWGIQGIPTVFAVDAEGNLASVEARGKLEEIIPDLLAKAKKSQEKAGAKP